MGASCSLPVGIGVCDLWVVRKGLIYLTPSPLPAKRRKRRAAKIAKEGK